MADMMLDVVWILVPIFVFFIALVAIVLLYTSYDEKKRMQHELALAQLKAQEEHEKNQNGSIIKEKEIVKEIILIPCQYCGSLNPQTFLFCCYCGAKRKL
jgi:hypothetical protein